MLYACAVRFDVTATAYIHGRLVSCLLAGATTSRVSLYVGAGEVPAPSSDKRGPYKSKYYNTSWL